LLWRAHCALGPGRFTAETLLDLCALVGIAKGEEATHQEATSALHGLCAMPLADAGAFDATRPIAPLDPNRFAQSSGNFVAGQIQLDTQRFLSNSTPLAAGSQPSKA